MRYYLPLLVLVLVFFGHIFAEDNPAKDNKPDRAEQSGGSLSPTALSAVTPTAETEILTLSAGERVIFNIIRDDKGVVKDKRIDRIEVDGVLANPSWPLEFYACAENSGKEHETLVIMFCKPQNLHLGLILMGLKEEPDEQSLQAFGDPKLPGGDIVQVFIAWQDKDNKPVIYAAEDLIINNITKKQMPRIGWAFTGSKFVDDIDYDTGRPTGQKIYQANYSKTVMATWHDSTAILNDPTSGGHYSPYTEILPERGTRVVVTFKVPDEKELVQLRKNLEEEMKLRKQLEEEYKKKQEEEKSKSQVPNPK
ncbi:MAG: YdjY domain-containing protein [Candidatus Brocadiia bacterium]